MTRQHATHGGRRSRFAAVVLLGVAVCVAILPTRANNYHECKHDSITHKLGTPPVVYVPTAAARTPYDDGLVDELAEPTAFPTPDPLADAGRAGFGNRTDDGDVRARRHLVGTFGSIRMFIDTSRLSNDPGFMCQVQGQTYTNTLDTSLSGVCTAADVMTAAKRTFLVDSVLASAKDYFSRALQVESVVGNLVMPKNNDNWCASADFMCCGKNQPEQSYTTGYPDTDFVLWVTGRPTGGSTIAWALTCMTASGSVRPIAGHANFGPALINNDLGQQVSTAIHEVSHALGFSSSMFGLFRVPGTTTPRGSSNVMKSFTERGHTVRKIVTEEVVAKAKEQFDCPNWGLSAGGEVEDGGAAGTVGSHWEKRVYMNEYMTGTLNSHLPAVYSAMTLALFQDSGWYQVDYSVAEKLAWGNGQGCAFAQDYCSTWPSTYFCRQTNRGGCFPNLFYKGKCNFVDNEQLGGGKLTSWYRYFPESDYWGGISSVADHCPYYNVASGGDCRDSSNTDIRPLIGESAGVSSRCFTGTFARSDAHVSLKVYHAGCLRTTCDEFSQAIVVQLRRADHRATDYLDVTCPKSGTEAERTLDLAVVTSGEFDGTLICPPSTDVCTGNPCDTNTCSGHGTCQEAQDGVCLCQTNFYGDDAYHCDKVRCPTGPDGGGATVECSGHGTCQSDATQPNSGQCTCQTGYRSANCEERGCPQGPERTVCDAGGTNCRSEKTDCDGHGTCNTDTGECTCDAGYLPSDCVLTDCPKDGNGVYCYGNGNCDSTFGYCECKQTFSINATTGKEYVSRFFSGKDCATDNNGTSYPALYFTGEDAPSQFSVTNIDPSTGKAVPAAVTMNAEAYTYFSFNVESAAYQTELTLTWDDAGADPQMVACYAESCRQPTLHNAQFFVSTVDVALRKKVIVFVPDDTSPVAAAAFDRIGEMRVAIVSQTATTGTLSVTRDPCSFLQCVHGTCRNQKCVCDTPPSTVDGRYGGWSGALCDAPTCPGSPFACGDFRGRCEIEDPTLPTRNQFPVCRCNEGFTGVACSTTDTAGFSEVDASTPQTFSNVLDIGRNRTYFFSVKANDGILVELKSSTPDADPILLGQPGKVPPIVREAATAFDGPGWLQHKQNHTLSVGVVSDGIYFVRVINGRYATEPLAYTITFERHTDCSGGLNNCNGHGTCNKQCECGNGYEGIRCELAVPTLAKDSTTTVDVERGDWKYYVYKSTATAVEVEVKITGISVPAKAQPLLMVGATTQRRANNLRIITDESAYFDYDGFTSTTKDQTVTMRIKGVSFYFIGVHNTRNSWHDVKVALTVTERATPAFSGTGCGASAAATRQCEQQLCHGRGSYSTDANSHPFCVCESGWSTTTLCGTPRFTSFVNLLASAQEVGFLCNLCNFDIPMQENGLRVYKIPQPLQKATGLTIAATSANASQPGNPSLLVSEYLPRSIVDFRFVSSSSSSNETLKLTTQSPTGRYWLVVYANVEATYRVTAERESTPGQPLFSSTFMEELWDWVSNTNIGFVTAVVAGAIVLCLCIGCCWQVHQSGGVKGTAKQLRRNLSEVGTTLTDIRASSRHLVYRNAQPRSSQADNASAALSLQLAQIAQQAANERVAARGGAPVQHIRGAHSPAPAAPYQQMNQTPTRPPMPSAPPGHHSPMRPGGHHSPMPSPQFHGSPVPRPASQGYPQPQGYPQGGGYPQPGRSPHGNLPPVQRAQPPTRRR